ncbi:MAG TPA: hypothetical protein VFT70_15090 [Nocardioides sp.]|nr:hypothetical protein [Nocardioides sp.]
MTTMQERPARLRRPAPIAIVPPPPRPMPIEPRRAPTVGIVELLGRRPDLQDVYTPATIAADSILWSA